MSGLATSIFTLELPELTTLKSVLSHTITITSRKEPQKYFKTWQILNKELIDCILGRVSCKHCNNAIEGNQIDTSLFKLDTEQFQANDYIPTQNGPFVVH